MGASVLSPNGLVILVRERTFVQPEGHAYTSLHSANTYHEASRCMERVARREREGQSGTRTQTRRSADIKHVRFFVYMRPRKGSHCTRLGSNTTHIVYRVYLVHQVP
jgi:hypothetical protein